MIHEKDNQKKPKHHNNLMRIRIQRNTFLAIQFYFKELSCSQDMMEVVCRKFLLHFKPEILALLDKLNSEEDNSKT